MHSMQFVYRYCSLVCYRILPIKIIVCKCDYIHVKVSDFSGKRMD